MPTQEKISKPIIIDIDDSRFVRDYIVSIFEKTYREVIEKLSDKKILCLNSDCEEIYLVDKESIDYMIRLLSRGIKVYSLSLLIGFIRENRFIPSPYFLELLYSMNRRIRGAVVARERGARAFLYGNDLLLESVYKIYEPFRRGLVVGVIDRKDMRVIGVGEATTDLDEAMKWLKNKDYLTRPVVINKFDLGVFLREQDKEDLY